MPLLTTLWYIMAVIPTHELSLASPASGIYRHQREE